MRTGKIKTFPELLLGGDLRRLRGSNRVAEAVNDQRSFDELFSYIFHHERPLVMRVADSVEKISRKHPEYLLPHKTQLLALIHSADHQELKWHIAQLLPRLPLSDTELESVWNTLAYWARNVNESKIVRVNALQGLHDLALLHPDHAEKFNRVVAAVEHEPVPSIQARLRKLRKEK